MTGLPARPGKSMEWRAIIAAPEGSQAKRLSHCLELSADVTLAERILQSQYAPIAALPYQLLITVTATGELQISELLTSAQMLGQPLQINHYLRDSSKSQSSEEPSEEASTNSRTHPWAPRSTVQPYDLNCISCNMPLTAFQHIWDGEIHIANSRVVAS